MKITFTAIVLLVLIIASAQDAVRLNTSETGQIKIPTKSFTDAEREEMTKNDEVKKLVERVNASAVAKDCWKKDFRRALYDAFNEQYGKYIVEKYNHGEEFVINGGAAR